MTSSFSQDLVILQFSNFNFAVFDKNGSLVKLNLSSLGNQTATLNYHLVKVKFAAISFTHDNLLALTESTLHIMPLVRKNYKHETTMQIHKSIFRRCRKIAVSFPVNVI